VVDNTITLGIVVAVCSPIGPALVAWVQSRNRRAEKKQDYAREDAVAKQAAEAARLLVERQDAIAARATETAKLLATNTAAVAESAQRTSDKLDVIHVLVNSNMTAAMQAEFDATTREAAMIQEVMDLKRAAGTAPTVEALAALESARAKIAQLGATLADRLDATAAGKSR
jgi:hypothetical protein